MPIMSGSVRGNRGMAGIALCCLMGPAEAQHPPTPMGRNVTPSRDTCASVRCVAHFMHERQCIAWTDGCQIVARASYDFGRYIARGFLVPQRSQNQRTYLLLSLDPPVVIATLSQFMPVSTCPRRHDFACVAGSPPPAPPIEGAPMGPLWIAQTEIHVNWTPAGAGTIPFGCLPIDYAHTKTMGDLPSRRRRPSLPIVSRCQSFFDRDGVANVARVKN